MKFKVIFSSLLIVLSLESIANDDEIDKFFKLYDSGKVAEAVDSIYSTNKWIDGKSDDIEKVKSQLSNFGSLVGEYYGKEKLGSSEVNGRLKYVSYLALFERQPVRLEFVFYKPKKEWIIYSFSFDDSIDDELVNSGRKKIVESN